MARNFSATVRWLLQLFFVFISLNCFGQSKPKILIITGNGNLSSNNKDNSKYPPWDHEFQNEKVVFILKENIDVDVDVSDDLSVLNSEKLRPYSLIISNSIF